MHRHSLVILFALALAGQAFAVPFRFSPKLKDDRMMALRALPRLIDNINRDLSDDLLNLLMELQQMMQEGNPDMNIPVLDPFVWDHFETEFLNEMIELLFSIDGLDMVGLSNFMVSDVEFDLLQLRVDIAANWPELHVMADHYFLDGTIMGLLPLYGEGYMDMSVVGLSIAGGAKLVALPDSVSVTDVSFAMDFEALEGVIDGLLGGGDLGDVFNEILNLMGADLFGSLMQMAADDIALMVQGFINQFMEGMTLQDILNLLMGGRKEISWDPEVLEFFALGHQRLLERSNANDYVDALLENVRDFIVENGFDNFALPDFIEEFSEEFLWIEWHGEASLTEGFMRGLESVHRTGDATLDTSGSSIVITANVGFNTMNAGYHMHVDFMDIGVDVDAGVTIESVAAYFQATLIVGETLEITIDQLELTEDGLIDVDISGLGFLDFLLEGLSWIVVNLFGGIILDAITGPLKDALQNALGEILPFKYLM